MPAQRFIGVPLLHPPINSHCFDVGPSSFSLFARVAWTVKLKMEGVFLELTSVILCWSAFPVILAKNETQTDLG